MNNVLGQTSETIAIIYKGEVRYVKPTALQWGVRPGIDKEETWLLRAKTAVEGFWVARTYRLIDITMEA